ESQGDRYTSFLEDLGLIDANHRITEVGRELLSQLEVPPHPPLGELIAKDVSLPQEHRVWVVRAGSDGKNEQLALSEGAAVIGWDQIPDLSDVTSQDDVREIYKKTYPDHDANSAGQSIGQLFRFAREIKVGDLVLLPLKTHPAHVAVGRVTDAYRYR